MYPKNDTRHTDPCDDSFEEMENDAVDNDRKKSKCQNIERKAKEREYRSDKNIEHAEDHAPDKIKFPVLETLSHIDLDARLSRGVKW
jgi:hypothetical protein